MWGRHGILCPPRLKKWVGHVPRVPHQIAPMYEVNDWCGTGTKVISTP